MAETQMITTDLRTANQNSQTEVQTLSSGEEATTGEVHTGPHIPLIQGEVVYGFVSNTNITTFIFLLITVFVSVLAKKALTSTKKSRLKLFFLSFVGQFDRFLRDSFDDDKKMSRDFLPLIGGIFFIIIFGNFFGLIIDWVGSSVSPTILEFLRPMHSDLNTTLVLGTITVFTLLYVSVRTHGGGSTLRSYFFNFSGHSTIEKCINVFVGWLHAIGVFSTLASLSLRLFGNIFAGIVLIGVIAYLGAMSSASVFEIGRFATIPFWFFEVFVAVVQAGVFALLTIAYVKNASAEHH